MYLKDFYTWRGTITGGFETDLVLAWVNEINDFVTTNSLSNGAQMISDMKNFFLTVDAYWNTYHNTWSSNDEDQTGSTAIFKKLLMSYLNLYESYVYLKHMSRLPSPYTGLSAYEILDIWPFNIDIDSEDTSSPSPRNDFRSLFVPFRFFLADQTESSPGGSNPCFLLTNNGDGTGSVTESNNVLSQIRDALNVGRCLNSLPTSGTNNKRFVADSGSYTDQNMLGYPLNNAPSATYSAAAKFQKMAGAGSSGKDDLDYKKFNRRNILLSGKGLRLEDVSSISEKKSIDYMLNKMNLTSVMNYFNWSIVGINS